MLPFKPYPPIGNYTDAQWMAQVRAALPEGALFAVQEKVHGANVSFLCDAGDIRMARRTAVLSPMEPFYRFQDLLDRYSGRIYHIFNLLWRRIPDLQAIAVYGELFGGAYPHPLVPPEPLSTPVQQGIWYCPGYEFYAFDIYVFTEGGGRFLDVEDASGLFSDAGLLYARSLAVGTLDEVLSYPCAFPTQIPLELGLPLLPDNLCEGIVLKPLEPILLPDGGRLAVKKKNPAFWGGGVRKCSI